jgi:DNA polymerase IIIc chi subunit
MLEVVSTDPADRDRARARFRLFKEQGYPLDHHDLAQP